MLPLSREITQFQRLKCMLAVYRVAFGQPRQEDLLCYLASHADGVGKLPNCANWRLRLSPASWSRDAGTDVTGGIVKSEAR
jgi:hypothetical protein